MQTKIWTTTILAAIILTTASFANADVNELAAESLEAYNKLETLESDKREKTKATTKRISELEKQLKEMRPKEVSQHTRTIERYNKQIQEWQEKIKELQTKIDQQQKDLTPEQKANQGKMDSELQQLRTDYAAVAKPIDKIKSDIRKSLSPKNQQYEQAMLKYCLAPADNIAGAKTSKGHASMGNSIFNYNWHDESNTQIAWAHLRLRDIPEKINHREKLDGKYPITSHSNSSIWLWAGHYQVCFVFSKKELHSKENIAKAVQQLIDLNGLAAINAKKK